jgi:uracil-DNA glycosylase
MKKSWDNFLKEEKEKKYYLNIINKINHDRKNHFIYPPEELMLNSFKQTPIDKLKVVILGQDPYHQAGQGNGIAFSVNSGVKIPPSLRNIFKSINVDNNKNGDLTYLSNQGVLLLNTVLTVIESKPNSHKDIGWLKFTGNTINYINKEHDNLVFMLWGKNAHGYESMIDSSKHLIIKTSHPSPLGAYKSGDEFTSFNNSEQFQKANDWLIVNKKVPINWKINSK